MRTKAIPDRMNLTFSTSLSHNSDATGKEVWTSPAGKWDWLGFGGGSRGLPDILSNYRPTNIKNSYDTVEEALRDDSIHTAFKSTMQPRKRIAPMNQSYALSFSNSYFISERPLGVLASLSYSRSFSHSQGRYRKFQDAWETDWTEIDAVDSRSKEKILWGALMNVNYPLHMNHRLSSQFVYNRNAENTVGYLAGDFTGTSSGGWYEERMILYTEQGIANFQLNGEHLLKPFKVDWSVNFGRSSRNDPDHRYFPNNIEIDPITGDTAHQIVGANYFAPERYFREITEDTREMRLNIMTPVLNRHGRDASLKFGLSYIDKNRENLEKKYSYEQLHRSPEFTGDADEIVLDWMGIDWNDTATVIDTTMDTNIIALDSIWEIVCIGSWCDTVYNGIDTTMEVDSLVDTSFDVGRLGALSEWTNNRSFTASQSILAYYGMIEFPILSSLNFIGGVRFESSDFRINDSDDGAIKNLDALPSATLIYNLTDNMNLRAAYSHTIARPSFRERGRMVTIDFLRGYFINGNPNLERTRTTNSDIRWEWFNGPGQLMAVSLFHKIMDNPIAREIYDQNNIRYVNLNTAKVYGIEFELRQPLDEIFVLNKMLSFVPKLENISFNGNLALIKSKVPVPEQELEYEEKWGDRTTRELVGQSPYVVNLGLTYESYSTRTVASLFYNVFGKRLSHVGVANIPDAYEQPAKMLDFTFSQDLWQGIKFKFSAKNILESKELHLLDTPEAYVLRELSTGRSLSFGLAYTM